MRLTPLLLVVLLGCGRSDVIDDEPPVSTQKPIAVCASTCTSAPSGVQTPLATTSTGLPAHWVTCAGCVRVSFDGLSPSDALTLFSTVKDWQRAAGESLCLKLDTSASSDFTDTDRRRIHVEPGVSARSVVTYSVVTGELLHARVEFGKDLSIERQLVMGMGRALGLASGDEGVSAITLREEGLVVPGPADVASLRAMYGEKPWCSPR